MLRSLPLAVFAAVLTLAPEPTAQRGQLDRVAIVPQHVAGNVHMLMGAGGNIGVSVGADGVLMVDDQFTQMAPKIRSAIEAIEATRTGDSTESSGKIRILVNTHMHGDHTGGNADFADEALIFAHANVRMRMQSENQPPLMLPVVTFTDSIDLHFNGETVRVIHLPGGHTDGDSYIWFRAANVAHLGDHFFSGKFPYVDVARGGSAMGLRDNIGRLLQEFPDDTQIIPGHGPLSTVDDLRKYHEMLTETIEYVRAGLAAGKTPDDMRRAGFDEKWASWGTGFINAEGWMQIIVDSFGAEDHN